MSAKIFAIFAILFTVAVIMAAATEDKKDEEVIQGAEGRYYGHGYGMRIPKKLLLELTNGWLSLNIAGGYGHGGGYPTIIKSGGHRRHGGDVIIIGGGGGYGKKK